VKSHHVADPGLLQPFINVALSAIEDWRVMGLYGGTILLAFMFGDEYSPMDAEAQPVGEPQLMLGGISGSILQSNGTHRFSIQ